MKPNQCKEILNIIKKNLNITDKEYSKIVDKCLKYIITKRDEFKLEFEIGEKDYRRIVKKEVEGFPDKKLGELEISKELQKIIKGDLLVSYDFNSFCLSAQIDKKSSWPKIETVYLSKK